MEIDQFVLLAIFAVLSAALFSALLYIEYLISSKRKNAGMGKENVESGERTISLSRVVGFEYYQYILLFVVIEAFLTFLLPLFQDGRGLGAYFIIGTSVGLLYLLVLVRYLLPKRAEV